MSESNVEVVRAMTDAFLCGDYDTALAALDPEVVYEFDLGTYRRYDGMREVFGEWLRVGASCT